MMEIQRGMRGKLEEHVRCNDVLEAVVSVSGGSVYDYTCFGLDASGKLSDDRYMLFYNQTSSPNQEVVYQQAADGAHFRIRLSALPVTIDKLVFTVSIDGNGTMAMISSHTFAISQGGTQRLAMRMTGKDFHAEKAIISVELYRKGGIWRFAAVANGFNGGLPDLLKYYGGEEVSSQPAPPPPPPKPIPAPPPPVKPAALVVETPPQSPAPQKMEKISLKKGQKINLTKKEGNAPIRVENGWTAAGKDYDLKALVRYRNGRTIYIGAANADEKLSTPDGAVRHGGDVKVPGELEHIEIRWHPDIASVAVSSYSAIENGTGSFHRYGVYVRIINGRQIIEIPAADTSANDRSYTLCFGEIIFGKEKDMMEVSALEMYSRPNSEHRIGYQGSKVVMDIGPTGRLK